MNKGNTMSSVHAILNTTLWEAVNTSRLVSDVAKRLNISERSVYRRHQAWQEGYCAYDEDQLRIIKDCLDQAVAESVQQLKHRFKGMILITDDESCKAVQQAMKLSFENQWAVLLLPFGIPSILHKSDIPVYVVFRNPEYTEVLARTEQELHDRAVHQAELPPLTSGDHVIFIAGWEKWLNGKLLVEFKIDV